MASLSKRSGTGSYSIQFEDLNGIRRTITLGRIDKRGAEQIKRHVEALIHAQIAGTSPDPATSRWLATANEKLVIKLSKAGLVQTRQSKTLGAFIDEFIAQRKADPNIKPRTITAAQAAYNSLTKHFGKDRALRSITKGDARAWRTLIAPGRAENTVRKWTANAKTVFNSALEHELIEANPFASLPASSTEVRDRMYFVSRDEADKVLAECPTIDWRLIFALSRYGGLRCPSEVLALRWGDILWDQNRFVVRSVKTERHEGHENRVVPIFPELAPLFYEAFSAAEEGSEYVVTKSRNSGVNLRTTMHKIIIRAGLKPWPKVFQNLRATRATELVDQFPAHVATAWLGHSEKVARKHYRQVTDDHFAAAISQSAANALQTLRARGNLGALNQTQKAKKPLDLESLALLAIKEVAEGGLEPPRGLPPSGF